MGSFGISKIQNSKFKICLVLLLIFVLVGAAHLFNLSNRLSDSQLNAKLSYFAQHTKCENGLKQVKDLKPGDYREKTRENLLRYRMSCYDITGEYKLALSNANELLKLYKKSHNAVQINYVADYIETLKVEQNVQKR